jgi:hypothetical protein
MKRLRLMLLSVLLATVLVSPVYAWTDYSYRSSSWSRSETIQPQPIERETRTYVYREPIERETRTYVYRDADRFDPPYREYRYYYHEPDHAGLRLDVPFFSFRLG